LIKFLSESGSCWVYQLLHAKIPDARRELIMREICEANEATYLQGTRFAGQPLVGNDQLRQFYRDVLDQATMTLKPVTDPELKEVLFRALKDLILHHGFTIAELV
jgi:hypothetical protein